MISVTATGRLAADPTTNEVGGNSVANFTILSNRKVKGEDRVTAIDCSVWGKKGEIAAQYLKKGRQVIVSGAGDVRGFKRSNGDAGANMSVMVDNFEFVSSAGGGNKGPAKDDL